MITLHEQNTQEHFQLTCNLSATFLVAHKGESLASVNLCVDNAVHRPYKSVKMFGQNALYNYVGGALSFRQSKLYVDEYDGQVVPELVFSIPAHQDFTIYVGSFDEQLSSEYAHTYNFTV